MRPVLVATSLAFGVAALGIVLGLPAAVLAEGGLRALFVPIELGLAILALVASARAPYAAWVRRVVVALYAVLLVFLAYEHEFETSFRRKPALIEDWRFALNLVHFLAEMKTWRWHVFLVGSLAGAVAFVAALSRFLAALQRRAPQIAPRRLGALAALWLALGVGTIAALGQKGPVQFAGARLVDNYRASVAARARLGALRDAKPDDRYRVFHDVRLAKRPSFYFLVVEAYGQVLATWDMTTPYRALMTRVQARLEAAGYRTRTGYSSAPVHGGRSWLSLATMQSGMLLDTPESFTAFETSSLRIPTLAGFLREQGYHTASLEPGTKLRTGLGHDDLYAHELRVDAARIAYGGPPYGFGGIPDRYSLDVFRRRFLPQLAEPRYFFYMAVSTHFPWGPETVPPFEASADWPPLPGVDLVGSELRRWYLKSVEYEWRVLLELLEEQRSEDIVVVILGDHQPRLESNQPGEVTFDTPVHVLSRDGAFVERFAARGFAPGMYAEPGRAPPLVHEALFSLLVTELAGAYGTPETRSLPAYHPAGIGLGGLNP